MNERLFEPFVDAVDGVICVSAEADARIIAAQTEPLGLRFPLVLQEDACLSEQVAASGFAPASSRFGPYCDNITGMNWELPDGRRVRIGERVVKSTAGYDLLRFLLGTGIRYGRPTDYVLRLRPACDGGGLFSLMGQPRSLEAAAAEILHSSFLHWLDSVEWMGRGEEAQLRVGIHCPKSEWPVFVDFLTSLSERNQLACQESPGDGRVSDGLPDLVLKTTPDRVIPLARALVADHDVRCSGLCYCGVVHVFLARSLNPKDAVTTMIGSLEDSLEAIGGDWHSRHCTPPVSSEAEEKWIDYLTTTWKEKA